MKRLRLKKAKNEKRRRPQVTSLKSTAYHYSARRSDVEKNVERKTGQQSSSSRRKAGPRFHMVPFAIGMLAITVSVGYLSLISSEPQINIKNAEVAPRSQQEYVSTAKQLLSRSFLNRSKLTIDTESIAGDLRQKYPEIQKATVSTPVIRHKPVIDIELASPSIILETSSNRYLLDRDGRTLMDASRAQTKSVPANLPVVQDRTGVVIATGKPALTSDQVRYIYEIAGQSQSRGLMVSSMEILAGGGELDVRYEGLSYYVKFNLFEDARKSSGTFFAAKERLEQENKLPAEYIDVRVPERAYVK